MFEHWKKSKSWQRSYALKTTVRTFELQPFMICPPLFFVFIHILHSNRPRYGLIRPPRSDFTILLFVEQQLTQRCHFDTIPWSPSRLPYSEIYRMEFLEVPGTMKIESREPRGTFYFARTYVFILVLFLFLGLLNSHPSPFHPSHFVAATPSHSNLRYSSRRIQCSYL